MGIGLFLYLYFHLRKTPAAHEATVVKSYRVGEKNTEKKTRQDQNTLDQTRPRKKDRKLLNPGETNPGDMNPGEMNPWEINPPDLHCSH